MVEKVGRARFHQRNFVNDRGGVRKELGNKRAALAVRRELPPGAEQFGAMAAAHEGESFSFDERLWNGLTIQLDQLWLVIEQLELAWAAGHEKEDDVFRSRREMWGFGRERIHNLCGLSCE